MSWFTRAAPDDDSALLREALEDVLRHLEDVSDEPPVRLVRLRERLARPPVPTGLRRELSVVLGQLAAEAEAAAFDDTPAVVAEMASALVDALDASSLLDVDLVSQIDELGERLPPRVGRGDARQLARDAERIREVALPAKERAVKTRAEVARLVTALSEQLSPGMRHAAALDWGIGELSTRLASAAEPEAVMSMRQELVGLVRDLAGHGSAVRARLSNALDRVRQLEAALAESQAALQDARATAERDALTGLLDRGGFDSRLLDAVRLRSGERATDAESLCLAVLDIDHFKRINDTFGHPVGDEVLRRVADTLRTLVRTDDVLGRIGGEEFGILLHGTSMEQALEIVERIREQVGAESHPVGGGLTVTVSAGIAMHGTDETALSLYKRADGALYTAKEQGRNRFVLAA